ncbi:MAG: cupredoxin domain-containing protein, partial [Candidatus Diapherotrites archaeon]|nr:cupredoxin domain-containing protein [Candidatus Diapherotrites archaeon]
PPPQRHNPRKQTKVTLNNVAHVQIKGFAFIPAKLTVQAGDQIVFENKDPTDHSVVIPDLGIDQLVDFDSTTTVTITNAGTYDYTCGFHPTMKGQISVTP